MGQTGHDLIKDLWLIIVLSWITFLSDISNKLHSSFYNISTNSYHFLTYKIYSHRINCCPCFNPICKNRNEWTWKIKSRLDKFCTFTVHMLVCLATAVVFPVVFHGMVEIEKAHKLIMGSISIKCNLRLRVWVDNCV